MAESGNADFATTRWSLVLEAARRSTPAAGPALDALCETYWYPLYAYVRRRGWNSDEARDLTQGFFAVLLEKGYLADADRERGRFRTFLLTAIQRYLSKERERAAAQKRGGGIRHLTWDYEDGERRLALEPTHDLTAERVYLRRWALTVLENALARLRLDYSESGKSHWFEALKVYLTGESGEPSYQQTAEHLAATENAVKVAVFRLRQKYREAIRKEVAETVSDPADVEEELRALVEALQ